MKKVKLGNFFIVIKVKLSLWSAIKIRIAGFSNSIIDHRRVGDIEKTTIKQIKNKVDISDLKITKSGQVIKKRVKK